MQKVKIFLTVILSTLLCVSIILAATVYTDSTPDNDETVKVISKTYTPDPVEVTVTIDMGKQIDKMNHDKKDIESILTRFNSARAKYNEALGGLKSKTANLAEATCSFPTIPEKVQPVEDIEAIQ